jgi:hypothetical protein
MLAVGNRAGCVVESLQVFALSDQTTFGVERITKYEDLLKRLYFLA